MKHRDCFCIFVSRRVCISHFVVLSILASLGIVSTECDVTSLQCAFRSQDLFVISFHTHNGCHEGNESDEGHEEGYEAKAAPAQVMKAMKK